MTDNQNMRMLSTDPELNSENEFDVFFSSDLEVTAVPRGRTGGLFGALVGAVCDIDEMRVLPLTAIEDLGKQARMFDYDPAEAVALDIA